MKTIKQSVALAIMMGCATNTTQVLAADMQLQDISARTLGNSTEVQLKFSAPVTQIPKGFTLETPSRLVFDFPNTEVSPDSRSKTINLGKVQSIDAANNKGQARVVVRMDSLVDHSIEAQGNRIIMLFDNGNATALKQPPPVKAPAKPMASQVQSPAQPAVQRSSKAAADAFQPPLTNKAEEAIIPELPLPPGYESYAQTPADPAQQAVPKPVAPPVARVTPKPVTPPAAKVVPKPVETRPVQVATAPKTVPVYTPPAPVAPVAPSLQGIDFRREPDGSGRVIIDLPEARTEVSDEKRGNTITITLHDIDIPKNLIQRMDVLDFGTPVSEIDVDQRGMNGRIRITANEGFEHRIRRNGSEYTVYVDKLKVAPEEKLAALPKNKKNFNGEKLSLNFQDIEVRAVLQLLADFTNKNIVVSDTVDGNITIRLKDVPWDQALDIVLESKSLGMRENGNVIWVAPASELSAKEQQELASIKAKQELEPLITQYIAVNFAKAADLAALIEKSQGEDKQSLMSPRGKVSVDERTNTLLVRDTATQVSAIRDLVKALDVPVEQVLIESRIVTANDEFGKELGARFGVSPKWVNQDSYGIGTGHLGNGTDDYFDSIGKALADETGKTAITLPGLTDRLSVNLPVTGSAGSFGFSVLSRDFMIDLELSALQAESKGEIISSPRVITSNQTKALIEQGVEIPYLQASSSGATNVAFKKAVLSLEVTPQITPDEHISLDLKVNQDTVGQVFSGVPSINTREVQTKVLVENGQTVVLGGVHEEENLKGNTKVPVLGDLPVVGKLFGSKYDSSKKRELLIFVTPKIVDGEF